MASSKVTLNDVYTVVNRVEDKLDSKVSEFDVRLREVESKQSRQGGINATIAFITSAIIGTVSVVLRK